MKLFWFDTPYRLLAGRRLQIALLAAAILCLASCGAGAKKDGDGMFTFGLATEVDDYDPFTNLTADGRSVLFNIFEGLVRVASNEEMLEQGKGGGANEATGRFLPCLAVKWEHNEDCSKWKFWIRDGVRFHDGSSLAAEDAARSLIMANKKGFAGCENIKEVACEGGAVCVTLSSGDTSFIAAMTSPIVKYGDNGALANPAPLGTGPYMLKGYAPGDCCVLQRNEYYYGTKPKLPQVKVKFIGTQSALPLSLLSGAIDGFVATGDLSNEVADDKGNKYTSPSNAVQVLSLNNDAPQFRDVRVRRAVRALIDADTVIKSAAGGYGLRAISPVIPALMENDSKLLEEVAFDSGEGERLLKEAEAEGLAFCITVPSSYTVHVKTAEVICDMLSRYGITCTINQVDWATWLSEVYVGRKYESTIISVDASLATSESFLSRYVSHSSNNFANFRSAAFDAAFDALQRSTQDKDKAMYTNEAVKALIDEAASVWIQDIEQVTVYNKRFTGFRSYPLFAIDFAAIAPVI